MANYLVTGGGFHRFAGKIYNSGCERGISVNQLVSHGNDALGTAFDAVYKDPRPGDVRVPVADISPGPAGIQQPGHRFRTYRRYVNH
ncbi:MAG: hypothetical protein CME15_06645 [Gemmatimonadetes bacterium]|nr:hypothetical protein [Gemmatimonadota bacterium]